MFSEAREIGRVTVVAPARLEELGAGDRIRGRARERLRRRDARTAEEHQ